MKKNKDLFTFNSIEHIWSDGDFHLGEDRLSFKGKDNNNFTIILPISDISKEIFTTSIAISASFPRAIQIAFCYIDGSNSSAKNILPFYLDGEFTIPCSLIDDAKNKLITGIYLNINDGIDIKSLYLLDGYKTLKLKIMLYSGIGDSLRAVSRNSAIKSYMNDFPCEIYWSYGGHGLKNGSWQELLKEYFFDRTESFIYIPPEDFDAVNAFNIFNGYSGASGFVNLFEDERQGLEIRLTSDEMVLVNEIKAYSGYRVGIQLAGNDPKKVLKNDMLLALFQKILSNREDVRIYIIDAPNRVLDPSLLFDSRVVNLIGITNFSQNLHLIQNMDCWIAPDSFSKYVANWSNVYQLILCCKLTYCEPRDMLISAFGVTGLLENKRVKILGLKYDENFDVQSYVNDVDEIGSDEIGSLVFNDK